MPKPTPLPDQVVTVCFAPGEDADWFAASEKVNDLLHANGTPARRFHVHHRHLIGWLTRFLSYYLLDAARRFGAITMAAGGRKGRLDLNRTAGRSGQRRHRSLAHLEHPRRRDNPSSQHLGGLPRPAPRHPSQDQPRRGPPPLRTTTPRPSDARPLPRPHELALYQAGEATYAGLYWRAALIGDALITTDGRLLKPASGSVADRFRFLNEACGYLRSLRPSARLCAVAIA